MVLDGPLELYLSMQGKVTWYLVWTQVIVHMKQSMPLPGLWALSSDSVTLHDFFLIQMLVFFPWLWSLC